ncbi:TDT family transporter [Streptococcus oricebi]|uniref:Ethanolamine utilization protein EutJ n=1 Tax=Streptococcus oricebi TaxID=1547447 RepID=A0ABS5B459_9STRE|nr:TDT family transporter [Streptococcus oricebi]MBP2623612.1 ethanolamine utilization protein EutJ [Streptococcus oricebi]
MIRKQPPLVFAGLILGLFGLANLLASHHILLYHVFSGLGLLCWLWLSFFLLSHLPNLFRDLQEAPLASSFATYPMSSMLLAAYLSSFAGPWLGLAKILWFLAFLVHLLLILYFTRKFYPYLRQGKISPSWTVLYVGIAMAALTGQVVQVPFLAWFGFVFGLVLSLLLYPFIFQLLARGTLPSGLRPQLAIFCAPFSLLLAAYIKLAAADFNQPFLLILFLLAQSFYLFALFFVRKIIREPFLPSFSALTFPLVISALSYKLSLPLLGLTQPFFLALGLVEEGLALLVLIYVLKSYLVYFGQTDEGLIKNDET